MNNVTFYYVYLHRRKTDNKVFYVGKGKGKRAYSSSGRNTRWLHTAKKHEFTAEIVFENLTEQDAFQLEKDTILEMRYHFGDTLCNMTDGGEGASGHKQSEETIRKRVLKNTGKKRTKATCKRISDSLKGRILTEEQKIKLSKAHKGVPEKPELVARRALANRGKKRSQSTKERMSLLAKQRAIESDLSSKMSGNSNPQADKTIYTFVHKSGEIFIGTRVDLVNHADINPNTLRNLFTLKRKSAFGWSLLKDENGKNETKTQAQAE